MILNWLSNYGVHLDLGSVNREIFVCRSLHSIPCCHWSVPVLSRSFPIMARSLLVQCNTILCISGSCNPYAMAPLEAMVWNTSESCSELYHSPCYFSGDGILPTILPNLRRERLPGRHLAEPFFNYSAGISPRWTRLRLFLTQNVGTDGTPIVY